MATIREITAQCRAGNIVEAYETAKADLAASPQNVWAQREVGWALYYRIKHDIESNNVQDLHVHFEEFVGLVLEDKEKIVYHMRFKTGSGIIGSTPLQQTIQMALIIND